jgi:integrase
LAGGVVVIRRRRLSSQLAPIFERFIALKHASGARYSSQERQLRRFDRYLHNQKVSFPLHREALLGYVATLDHLCPRGRDNVIRVVWQSLQYARQHGAAVDTLPTRPPAASQWLRSRVPRLVTPEEIRAILAATLGFPPADGLRSATYATLFGLLCATGMRVGEALALDIGDIDLGQCLLTIRHGKFGKARVLALRPSTAVALRRYIHDARRALRDDAASPIFLSTRGRRLSYPATRHAFHQACSAARIVAPPPRLHDLRHSFAVQRVVGWYKDGRDVNAWLPALSTYLGHLSVEHTRLYLRANGLLLEQAAARFEAATTALDEVTP